MQIQFTFLQGVEISDGTREYAERKLETAGKSLKNASGAEIQIKKDKQDFFSVAVSLRTDKETFRAEEERAESVESAIDAIERKLQEQIRDAKERRVALKRRGARSVKKKLVVNDEARF